ncbi:msx2-interacting protein [Osmerus eperlanus]|uniref:msx2-interacting protein n=1 Tax=Osmerus eperlanus TaxID=29151 RepID=UPI002E0D2B5F
MVRETRHLWVGNLPENVREEKIIEHFKRYGRVESVKVLPKRGSEGGVAAFVDFVDIKSAQKAHNSINKMGDRDLRTDYNEPGTIPSAARGLDDSLSLGSRARDVSGFTRVAGGPVYGPLASLHTREGRFERRLDGTAESRERAYDHSAYGHHDRAGSSFDRQRHYETDYYRDGRERTLSAGGSVSSVVSGAGGSVPAGVGASIVGAGANGSGAPGISGTVVGGSGASVSSGVGYYRSLSRSPCRFEATDPRYDPRAREPFTLASAVHRDLYREQRGRRGERTYHHSRSRSPHSSHSRNPSPQRLASQATCPPRSHSSSRSRSRSSSSDSVSSTSSSTSDSDSSSSSSDDSPARSVQSAAVPAPSAIPLPALDKDEPRKSFGIKVQNLPVRSTDTSLKDGLFHEFKKYGKVTSVQIHGASEDRYGLVFFRQQEDQEKAFSASKGKLFFGMQIDVTAWNGPETESENEFRPLDERIDEFHPKATRTLFIGNLEKTTSYHDLLNIFQRFGEIVDIDIKKVNGAPQYAFLQYCDIASVCKAIKKMDGEYLGNNRLKLGFGKSMPTTCVWLDGLASNTTDQYLTRHFCRYGHVVKVVFDRMKGMALILYNNIEYAQAAVKETKGWKIGGNKIKVDFANQESQMAFYRSMQASGQDIRDFYEILSERRDERRPQYEFPAERAFYENVRTPGTYTEDPRRKYPARGREFYTEWDPYQGDFYDPRYFDDPREYREYRDPYEQDIRKYSYLQRERERERERFETDRERDHGRRTIERSQSPSHPRRPASPTASPSLSERPPSDSDRRVCGRSSEQSESCSSLSPPRFEKPDKARTDRYNKSDKPEKERLFVEAERGNGSEKEKRTGRKEKSEKEKSEKQRLKKLKVMSPSIPSSETDPELERDVSPDSVLRSKAIKFLAKEKDGAGKGQLDLPPCVVQLTRVKEKEGKLIGQTVQEKLRPKAETESPGLASPTTDPRSPLFRLEPQKPEVSKQGKVPKDKNMASLVEVVGLDVKIKAKKRGKSDLDGSNSMEYDRLAARKRRFEESMGKTERLKRPSQDDEDGKLGLRKLVENTLAKETEGDKNLVLKGIHKKEYRKSKSDRLVMVHSPNDEPQESESISMGMGLSLELQSRLGEPTEEAVDYLEPPCLTMEYEGLKSQSPLNISDNGSLSLDAVAENQTGRSIESEDHVEGQVKSIEEGEEHLDSDIYLPQSCVKPIDHSHTLKQKKEESGNSGKSESPQGSDMDDIERCSVVHETGNPPHEALENSLSYKRKKSESLDFEILNKKELNYGSCQLLHEDLDQRITSSIGKDECPSNEEEEASQLSQSVTSTEPKDSLKAEEKVFSRIESLKYDFDMTAKQFPSPDSECPKLRTTLLGCDEELLQRWERRIKSDSVNLDMTFPSSIVKSEGIRKRLVRVLEPGEVQSDSDDDGENKHHSPKSSTSLSYILGEREERLTDLKLSGSLEKNKFYSFALDKTITPDTKALLERARSLSSSREDNWSFLPSRFPSSHSCSDKEKVELAPRPIPSWYMKKKKIRTDSEGKMCAKKEELKPQDQERQELFASRFLHSSIFEQDSRRLQHLKGKDHQHFESGVDKHHVKQGAVEGQSVAEGGDLPQEPIVLFQSRFLELQQKKGEQVEYVDMAAETEGQIGNKEEFFMTTEPEMHSDIKPVSPSLILPVSPVVVSPREMSPQHEKEANVTSSPEQTYSLIKEEKVEPIHEVSPPQSPPEVKEPSVPILTISSPSVLTEPEIKVETKEELCEHKPPKENNLREHGTFFEDKPLTPGSSLSSFEVEPMELHSSASPEHKDNMEVIKTEPQAERIDSVDFERLQKSETCHEVQMPVLEAEVKATQPTRKQPKSKRAKSNVSVTQKPHSSQTALEKPATRKSERIDKEKLKRASSPRGDVSKALTDPKTTNKSPIYAPDSEQNIDGNSIHGRARRRNVKSVYATQQDGEAQQTGKDVVESSRSTRKRGADKELVQQDGQNPATNTRRGRPPKARKRGEDVSPVKGDHQKTSEDDTDIKEPASTGDVSRVSEGWRSPRTLKVQSAQNTSPSGISAGRKASRVDKQSEMISSTDKTVDTIIEDPELDANDESEQVEHILVEESKRSAVLKNEKDSTDQIEKKSTEKAKKVESTSADKRQQSEKSIKGKAPRLTQNTKQVTEDKSHSLRNLEIRVSVDDVKGLLPPDEDEPESLEAPPKKTKPGTAEAKTTSHLKRADELCTEGKEEEMTPDSEPPVDPAAALLERQMELERAVENIAKLTQEQPPQPFKEPPTEPPVLRPPVKVEPEVQTEVEEEKPANPASETELAAAIDSITAEDISADTDGFTAPPTYTALIPTPEPLVSPPSSEVMEPETHMVITNINETVSDVSVIMPRAKPEMPDSKKASSVPEDRPLPETPKKASKIRSKTPKKSRNRKGAINRKGETVEEVSEPTPSLLKLPGSIPEDLETNSKAATVTAAATTAASVVTAAATCKRDIMCTMTVDTPKEAEQPAVEQPVPQESAFHSGTTSISVCKKPSTQTLAPALSPSPALTPPSTHFNIPPSRHGKMPLSPDWHPRAEDSRIHVTPASQVTIVTSSAPTVTTLGTPIGNPPLPPDTKASDIDPSSSTLRKILMEPKYVTVSNSNLIATTMLTTTLADPRMSENENSSDTRHPHAEDRPLSMTPQHTPQKPSPLTETQQNFGEKMHSVISSPTTSVISRIPMPFDTDEAPRISLSNRSSGLSLPKQKFKSSMNENHRYHGIEASDDGSGRGRSVVENTPYNTGSSPGLRVNTSEGVVVLSYSGQKMEGPQRISAKISLIPQASAGDIEFQQSVSKSQIKQEPLTPSQPTTPKGQPTPTGYGHTGVLLTGQLYNSQPVISSVKQENQCSDKLEASYHHGPPVGPVKMFQQPVTNSQVLIYNQAVMQQHAKKSLGADSTAMKDLVKPSNLSPVMSPHHPSLAGNRMSPSPITPTDRTVPHLKQEPISPRTMGHSPSPFAKACPPNSSPIGSVVMSSGMPTMSPYAPSVHHPHPEQSVIMPPHSVTQSASIGHISHGEVRMNTPQLSGMNYGRRADSLPSPRGPPQRSNTPQPVIIRDMVLHSHTGTAGPPPSNNTDEDPRHFHQALRRPSAPQLQSDVMMLQAEHRGLHPGLRLDQYRDMRILMHHQLGEHGAAEARQSRTPEAGGNSFSNISAPSKSPLMGKSMLQPVKETSKPLEGKMSHPPHAESRIMGVHTSSPVMVSPHPQGVPLMHPGGAGSFPVYRDMRGFPSQFPNHPSMGLNLTPSGLTPSQVHQEGDLGHRSKLSQSLSAGPQGGGSNAKSDTAHLRHTATMDLSNMSRMQRDTVSPSYPSPMALSHKQELTLQKSQAAFLSSPPTTALPSKLRPESKMEHSGHQSLDTVQLLTKYPILWQGLLALKNDQAAVQLHFVSGNNVLAHRSLPPPEGGSLLRIAQRMRLEGVQLEGVARRMMVDSDYCLLLALPCGRDQDDVLSQTHALKGGFITYLQAKQAAGIINVPNPGSNQPAYVVQIFPPCEFSEIHLSRLAPDLLNSISSISPHLMIVIASV